VITRTWVNVWEEGDERLETVEIGAQEVLCQMERAEREEMGSRGEE
jgi:hypothetical protein